MSSRAPIDVESGHSDANSSHLTTARSGNTPTLPSDETPGLKKLSATINTTKWPQYYPIRQFKLGGGASSFCIFAYVIVALSAFPFLIARKGKEGKIKSLAIRRRFQRKIHIPLPDERARRQLFKFSTEKMGLHLSKADYIEFGMKTKGFSGSDISNALQDALMVPLKKVHAANYYRKVNRPTSPPVRN
jgi:SpoVK/Ycf46/Vps4 family AAA+-type ATPase